MREREKAKPFAPWMDARTGALQRNRLERLGLRVGMLPVMRDVDEAEDAAAVARAAPDTRFGRLYRRLVDAPCSPTTLFDAALAGQSVEVRDAADEERGCVRSGSLKPLSCSGGVENPPGTVTRFQPAPPSVEYQTFTWLRYWRSTGASEVKPGRYRCVVPSWLV